MERQGMNSEVEAEGRVKSLGYKVRAASKESQAQRASQILDSDLRTHWSTGTNAKEWILFELEESCLLSHIRIHNKAVLEWEISISLRNKPETFLKVRPRCEAPRREITYNIGHLPCRFVRIACLRGNPIAIFYVQLMGISVPGLEPELQPIVDHFLPQIIARIKEPHDIQLQLFQDISIRLSPFLQQLEGDISVPNEVMDSTIRFLAMLVGPFYPFLALFRAVRDNEKLTAINGADEELGKSSLAYVFTVSSNFQAPPKRIRSPGLSSQTSGQSLALRPNSVVLLLKVAYKDVFLCNVCKKVARLLRKLSLLNAESLSATTDLAGPGSDENTTVNDTPLMRPADYSKLFGEEFRVPDDDSLDLSSASTLDVSLVEEALLHLLYACASQPLVIRRLADAKSDLSPVLSLLRSLLPALRPPPSTAANADVVDETFWQWQAPLVQRALNQVVALVTAPSYRPLLDACAGYLSAYSPAHEKSACVLIDLCAGPLAPWLAVIIAKVDLAVELLEDLLGIIQAGQEAPTQARAVLVYIMLALSGHVDEILSQYKIVKHKVLFIIEMLEPYLIPAIIPLKSTIAFGDVSAVVLEKHEKTCALALELLHTALQKPSILPAMEAEWRRGHVAPSVLLSILAPHVALPPGIDNLKCVKEKGSVVEGIPVDSQVVITFGTTTEEAGASEAVSKVEVQQNEEASLLFAPLELKGLTLLSLSDESEGSLTNDKVFLDMLAKLEGKSGMKLHFDIKSDEHEWDLKSEYWQLVDGSEREQRASDFIRFASELHSRQDDSTESQQSAIDALLLAAECHVNPFFMISSKEYQKMVTRLEGESLTMTSKAVLKDIPRPDLLSRLEDERDKAVLNILMCAAEWDTLGALDGEGMNRNGESSVDIDGISCDISIDEEDKKIEDAVTLVRQRQGMLCQFLIRQLQRDRHNLYEVLLQGLLFVLHSATQLSSTPEDVIDVILGCANRLNVSLVEYHSQGNNGILSLGPGTFHGVRRQWVLLRKLVLVASGGEVPEDKSLSQSSQVSTLHQDLIPGSAWMSSISQFATSLYPLVRYIGWMGVVQYAQFHTDISVPLIADIQDLTSLLLIFSDELISIELLKYREAGENNAAVKAGLDFATSIPTAKSEQPIEADPGNLVKVLYPEFSRVFPSLRMEFSQFGDTLLQSICAHIEVIPRIFVPDMLSWFSEVCLQPFPARQEIRGFTLGNARYVILRLLEVIMLEHVEAILPELSRVFQVVISLCSSSYCDVTMLEAVLDALKPIISHATSSASDAEGETSVEILSYDTVMQQLRYALDMPREGSGAQDALTLYLGGFLLSSISYTRRNNVLTALKLWVSSRYISTSAAGPVLDTLSALQKILDECLCLLKEISGENNLLRVEKNDVAEKQGLHSLVDGANPSVLATSDSEALDSPLGGDITEDTAGDERETEAVNGDVDSLEVVETLETLAAPRVKTVDQSLRDKSSLDKMLFRQKVRELVLALGPGLEMSMKLHPQKTSSVAVTVAQCLYCAGITRDELNDPLLEEQLLLPSVKALGLSILTLQKAHCWQIASTSMEYLLSLPSLSDAFQEVCTILEYQCTHAPRVAWRLLPVQWLPKTFSVESLAGASDALIRLLSIMLEHPEPEQRAGVLRQVEKAIDDEESNLSFRTESTGDGGGHRSAMEAFVSAMWIPVVTTATSDVSDRLRKQASEVLMKMVPYVDTTQLQSLMISFDMIFKSGPLTRSGLSLLARVCLYSNSPDYDIIPSRVWNSIESLAQSKPGRKLVEKEREICQALIQLRNEEETAKEHMRNLLTSAQENARPHPLSSPVREAVVEVLARLSVLRSKAEVSTSTAVQEAVELEEAEIELELLREERTARGGDTAAPSYAVGLTPYKGSSSESGKDRLTQLRAQIFAEEYVAAKAEVAVRREKQRIARRNRQLALEEATLREMSLLQELEKERAAEAERDIERQRMLEKERAKTRELRLSLDIETERRSQKEYQRELEQREAGVVRTSSRREFASNTTPSSRPRERYRERERETQRSGQEGPARANNDLSTRETATTPPATPTAAATHPTTALSASTSTPSASANTSSSRVYGGPSSGLGRENARDRERDRDRDRDRDRSDERGGFEDTGEGNGASRDTEGTAFNDDVVSGVEGSNAGTVGNSHRQGPRSARPRQIVERRERDGRREGKWERKQT